MKNLLTNIANQFILPGEIKNITPLGEGFINDSFVVTTINETDQDYLLQRKNKNIFPNIPGMMENIEKVCNHVKGKVIEKGGDPNREALTVIKTRADKLYYQDEKGDYWAMCLLIKDHILHETADTPELAFSGGKGIGKFQSMLSDFTETLIDTLPGFHNMKFRFKQWDKVIMDDPLGRKSQLSEEISWIEQRREKMMKFWDLIEKGIIPTRITHNDTKISNILFDKIGDVLCVIDLDTVLSSTVLNDFGDAIRSYANTGLEDDPKLDNVELDIEIFEAFTEGYLSESLPFLTKPELDNLAFSAQFITFEQVLRFLMDYIDGDKYYKIKSPEHNLMRTRAQYKLLLSIEDQFDNMNIIVEQLAKKLS